MEEDQQLIETELDRKEKIRRYRGNYWLGILLCGAFGALAVGIFGPQLPDGEWSGPLAFGAIIGVCSFLADWISAVVFERKTRPWHWRRHPDDADPRK